MKLLYGTTNNGKLQAMKNALKDFDIELIGLNDLEGEIPQIKEDGATPLENAETKARAYFEAFHMPVFSCDSGLYFDNVPDGVQPGVHVRNVNGKYLSDEEMQEYYTENGDVYYYYGDTNNSAGYLKTKTWTFISNTGVYELIERENVEITIDKILKYENELLAVQTTNKIK